MSSGGSKSKKNKKKSVDSRTDTKMSLELKKLVINDKKFQRQGIDGFNKFQDKLEGFHLTRDGIGPQSPSRLPVYKKNGPMAHHSPMHQGYGPRGIPVNVCNVHRMPVSPQGGYSQIVPEQIRLQHEAHVHSIHSPNGLNSSLYSTPSTSGNNTPSTSRRPSSSSHSSDSRNHGPQRILSASLPRTTPAKSLFRFEDYAPLCEVQKSMKRGDVIEVSRLTACRGF